MEESGSLDIGDFCQPTLKDIFWEFLPCAINGGRRFPLSSFSWQLWAWVV